MESFYQAPQSSFVRQPVRLLFLFFGILLFSGSSSVTYSSTITSTLLPPISQPWLNLTPLKPLSSCPSPFEWNLHSGRRLSVQRLHLHRRTSPKSCKVITPSCYWINHHPTVDPLPKIAAQTSEYGIHPCTRPHPPQTVLLMCSGESKVCLICTSPVFILVKPFLA